MIFLKLFVFVFLRGVSGLDYSSLLSALNANTVNSIVNAYLGGNSQISGAISDLTTALTSTNKTQVVSGINDAMNLLSSQKIITGYSNSTNSSVITLGVLNTAALNSSMNGLLSTSLMNTVVSKLNQSGVISGLVPVSGGYNLGKLDVTSLVNKVQEVESEVLGSTEYPTSEIVFNFLNTSLYSSGQNSSGSTVLNLTIPKPLVAVSSDDVGNLTFNEKLELYNEWYLNTIAKMKAMNMSMNDPATIRAAMFCYPGPNPLPYSSMSTTPAIISCQELNQTFYKVKEESDDFLKTFNSPQNVAVLLKNSSMIQDAIAEMNSNLKQLSTIVSGSDGLQAVQNRIQMFGELSNSIPKTINQDSLSAFKSFASKYFQWTPTDFSNLVSTLTASMHQSREDIELVLQEVCIHHKNVDSIKTEIAKERRHSECLQTAKIEPSPHVLQRV
ncbi:hypothetical protein FO519_000749 [Halicephalobus sp. NKZ332]|nr:hypothetical protein FO519_000749 [Halicephalobus sp. NKZ332]